MNLKSKSDNELKAMRSAMPKYLNDMTEAQAKLANLIYAEQKHRYDESKRNNAASFNKDVESHGYRVGDKVQRFAAGLFGVGGDIHKGVVVKRGGEYMVKLNHPTQTTSGIRTYVNLSLNWKKA